MQLEKVKKAMALSTSNTLDEFLNELCDLYLKQHSNNTSTPKEETSTIYVLKWGSQKEKTAKGNSKDNLIVSSSDFAKEHTNSLSKSYIDLRQKLLKNGIIDTSDAENYKFAQEYLFPSFSTAASVIRGIQLNGIKSLKQQ
ncbi:DUF4357 domain-containing protein [Bacillus cereus]|uniref:DUF4357 domain-containing protein n=1 Tax=Bacillus cereus TaxID=1396 RepID=UPI0020BF0286|nr:DUF4357 domain-containing protein [Bacillus cereus]